MANLDGGTIGFSIKYDVDQSGLKTVENQLRSLSNMSNGDLLKLNPGKSEEQLTQIKNQVKEIRKLYSEAFDSTTGEYNLTKIKKSLNELDTNKLYNNLSQFGSAGVKAFRDIANQASQVNLRFRETNGFLNKMGETFVNTIKWSVASSVINRFTSSIQEAWGYVKHLDTSLNDIRIVTGKSADEMDKFAVKANNAAKALGSSTTEYTEAALIYRQQGLGDEETEARTETTLKAANVTGQTGREVSEELTAVWNGYKVTAEETEEYVDKLAAVAATTASDLEELSKGMSKVASAANNMGVDIDQLNAQLSTIISVTRQAPETAGTALKTIYARIEDLKLGGTDEDGIKLGQVSGGLSSLGIEIKNSQGDLRDLGEVIEEVGLKWDSWTESQQSAIAQLIAGKRQYNNLLALFDNWDMYTKALDTSTNAIGTLQNQQNIYLESTEAHLQQLSTEWEDLYDSLFDTKDVNSLVDEFTEILDTITSIVDSLGGGKGVLLGLVATLTKIGPISNAFSNEISNIITKSQNAKLNMSEWSQYIQASKKYLTESSPLYQERLKILNQLEQQNKNMTDEEKKQTVEQLKQLNLLSDQLKTSEKQVNVQKDFLQNSAQAILDNSSHTSAEDDPSSFEFVAGLSEGKEGEKQLNSQEGLQASKSVLEEESIALEDAKAAWAEYQQSIENAIIAKEDLDTYGDEMDPDEFASATAGVDNLVTVAETAKEKFKDLLTILGPASEEEINNLIDSLDESFEVVKEGGVEELDFLKEYLEDISEDIETSFSNVDEKINEAYEAVDEEQKERLEAAKQAAEQAEQERIKANQKIAQGITGLVSGVSSLGFSIQAIKSLGGIWSNEDLSLGEKIFQTITNMVTSIPMLVSSFSGIRESIKKIKEGAAESSNLVTTALEAETAATAVNTAATEEEVIAEGESAAGAIAEAGAEDVDSASKAGNTAATTGLISIIKTHIATRLAEKTSILGVNLALGAWLAIAAGAILITTAIVTAIKAEAEARRESNDKIIEENNQKQEAINKNIELADSYLNLYKEYQKTGKASDDLKSAAKECTETLDLQAASVQALAKNYDGLAKSIKEAKEGELQQGFESAQKERTAAEANLLDSATDGLDNIEGNNVIQLSIGYGVDALEEDDAIKILQQELGDNFTDYGVSGVIAMQNNADQVVAIYDKLIEAQQRMGEEGQQGTDVYQNISEWTSQVAEDVEKYKQAVKDIETYGTELAGIQIDENQIVDVDSYSKVRDKLIEEIKTKTGVDKTRAEGMADKWLTDNLSETAQQYQQQFDAAAELYKEHVGHFQEELDKAGNYQEGLDKEHVQNIVDYMVDTDTFKYQKYMTFEDWQNILGTDSLEEAEDYIQQVVNKYKGELKKNLQETASTMSDNMEDIIDKVSSGKLTYANIDEDETYTTMKENLSDLLTIYPELQDEANAFLTEGMVGSEEWAEAAYRIQDAYDQLEFDQLTQNYDDAINKMNYLFGGDNYDDRGFKIGVSADTDDFVDTIEEILEADYSIEVKLYTDGIDEFTDLESAIDNIDTMASKIGDNFIVAADDIRELNSTFPGILDQMTYLSDGTVKLNKEVVQSAMSAANEETTLSVETTATKLEQTAEELRAKADMYDSMSELASEAATNESELAGNKQEILNKFNEIESDNDQEVTDTELSNAHAVVDDSAENAPILAENWTKSYEQAAKSANEWADVALAANKRVATNGQTEKVDGDFKVNFTQGRTSSSNATSSEAELIENSNDAEAMEELSESFKNTATSYRQQANDLEGAAAELRAKAIDSANTIADVADGVTKTYETEEYLERDKDLYREINEELENTESILSRIQTINDHSWGESAKKALEDENDLLNDQLELYEEKAEISAKDLASQRAALEEQGVTFNSDGSAMTNSEEVLDNLYAEYNAMVDSYNKMTEDEQDAYESTLSAKKETIENIEDAMDDYEDSYSDYNDIMDDLLDTHYDLIANAVNQFNADVDVQLELDEAKDEWTDFWYDVIEDVDDTDFGGMISKSLSKLDILTGDNGQISYLTTHVAETVAEVNKQIAAAAEGGGDSLFGDDTALSEETLTDYRDKLITAVKNAKTEIDNMASTYQKALEDQKDTIDEQIEGLETVGDHLKHNIDLIKLVSGEKAYDAIGKQYEQYYENDVKLVEANKISMDHWKDQMDYYQQQMATQEEGSKMYKVYSDAFEEASKNYKDAVDDLDSSLEEGIKRIQEAQKNELAALNQALDKNLSEGLGLERIKNQWDLAIESQERFLDNIERSMGMEELKGEFDDILKDMDLRGAKQQEFLKFQDEELKRLNEKEKLTQFDIDELKARLEIKKQELALEEAQQNKTNLRLRRDNQGNYTYQYTANEDAVDEAEGGLLTAKREWYELVKNRNKEVSEEVLDIRSRMAQAEQDMADATLAHDEDAYNQAHDTYVQLQQDMVNVMGTAEDAKQLMLQGTGVYFSDVMNRDVLPMWDTTVQSMIDKWSGDGEDSFITSTENAITKLTEITEKYSNETETLLDTAGVNYKNLKDKGIDPTTDSLEKMTTSNNDLKTSLDTSNTSLREMETELQGAVDGYNKLKTAASDAIAEANKALNTLADTAVTTKNTIETTANAAASIDYKSLTSEGTNAAKASSEKASDNTATAGTASGVEKDKYTITKIDPKPDSSGRYKVMIFDKEDNRVEGINGEVINGASGTNYSGLLTEDEIEEWKKVKYWQFKTGGYTGDWNGEDGRLAMVHQKELVLNEADTSNMLSAISALRDIVKMNNSAYLNSLSSSNSIAGQLLAGIGSAALQTMNSITNNSNSQSNNVVINADFSNVRSADEIYQALIELQNYGAQESYSVAPYANMSY